MNVLVFKKKGNKGYINDIICAMDAPHAKDQSINDIIGIFGALDASQDK